MTLKEAATRYDVLRRRFFMQAEAPFKVPPTAAELRWAWLPAGSPHLARTEFDEDGDPECVWLAADHAPVQMDATLLHELTHMRDPNASCKKPIRGRWRDEQIRLAALGAPLL